MYNLELVIEENSNLLYDHNNLSTFYKQEHNII